jgi:primosomal protein N'
LPQAAANGLKWDYLLLVVVMEPDEVLMEDFAGDEQAFRLLRAAAARASRVRNFTYFI